MCFSWPVFLSRGIIPQKDGGAQGGAKTEDFGRIGKMLPKFAFCRAERKGKTDKTSRPRRDLCAALMAEWRIIYMREEKRKILVENIGMRAG